MSTSKNLIAMNNVYHTVGVSWDEKILKRRSMPQGIKITTQSFDDYMKRYDNWENYFRDISFLYDHIPNNIEGTFRYKDDTWDFMYAYFFRFSMIAAVSEKVKNILEELKVSKEEYVLKPIKVKECEGPYYLMFVKIIPESELLYSQTLFRNDYTKEVSRFADNDGRLARSYHFYASDIYLHVKYKCRDIINIQYSSAFFFSQRLVDAFHEHDVKGCEIGSYDHKYKLNFTE